MIKELFILECIRGLMVFVVPMGIFFVIMMLVIRRSISFFLVMVLLFLSLVGVFVFENYEVVQSSSSNGMYPMSCREWEEVFDGYRECVVAIGSNWCEKCSGRSDELKQERLSMREISRRLEAYQAEQQVAEAS